ncbi:P1 family peptidase [Candidatus Nomurabacteria bacterium]|nr:P1 family peptidase [Candidatus Saccharibacteria bacterium]MCB9821796.1 P1 family peptidase [Candidatus Nomurabacteria bacterium]
MINNTLTALDGVRVGHSTHLDRLTGCTVIIFDKPMPVAYKAYGGAVGAFNTESLRTDKTDYHERGLFVAGGSMQGLMCASEIMKCMIDDSQGQKIGESVINPSISGAIVWDKGMDIAPFDPIYGKEAYENLSKKPVENGNFGAGTGTTVGDFRWLEGGTKIGSMKAGIGSARVDLGNGIIVCALSVVNALGNVILPNGDILAGNRDEYNKFKEYSDLQDFVTNNGENKSNTTISIVGINVDLGTRQHYEKLAHIASHGQVRAIKPVHTSSDGDTVFVFSNRQIKDPLNNYAQYFQETEDQNYFKVDIIGNAAADAVQESIYDACRSAQTIKLHNAYRGLIPSSADYF